ncbi:tumor necrosis factor a (TNF superfamily, member 2) [Engraulis encrasicolus]|uniref:tumor necrosis factor a (TNF superfamily, member 2) n=1 Tax=Engraulis encrasicolus TaxID=184585 RepID=UPI002FD176DE
MIEVDLEVGLMAAEAIVAVEEEVKKTGTSSSSSPSRGWRIYVALLAIGLCAAAAIFFSVHDQSSMLSTQKEGESEGNEGNYNKESQLLHWEDDADQAFSVPKMGGLKLEDNKIVIPKNGLYFVYSQVSFIVNCVVSQNDDQPLKNMLEHIVFRKSTTLPQRGELLHARHTTCEKVVKEGKDEGQRWYTTVNVGAVFKLNAGDKLFTDTEPLEGASVDDASGQTFFGAFAL